MRNKLTALLRYNLPQFVREEHELFVAFVQAYYEFCELDGNYLAFLQQFEDNQDVDLATNEYLDAFIAEMAQTFPKNLLIDKNVLLKTIREFYLARGSEQSFKFLFTILFNTQIEIQYPKVFLHRSSDGKYESNDIAHITADNAFKFDLDLPPEEIAASIEGVTSGAQAVIDTFTVTYFNSQQIFILDISSYQGAFIPNEDVYLSINGVTVKESIYGLVNRITVDNGGTNYRIDDEVTITDTTGQRAKAKIKRLDHGDLDSITITNSGTGYEVGELIGATPQLDSPGYGFLGEITEVDGGGAITGVRVLNGGYDYNKKTYGFVKSGVGVGAILDLNGDRIGKILELEVFSSGIDYFDTGTINITITSAEGTGGVFTPVLSGIFNEPKSYTNADDWPSNYCRIQDSNYYQDYSYVIQSSVSPHLWLEQVKRVAHPAGMKLFGSLLFENEYDLSLMLAPELSTSLSIIIKLLYFFDINQSLVAVQAPVRVIWEAEEACNLDLTLRDLDELKFFDTFEWTIEPFADYTINDVITSPPCQPIMPYHDGVELTIDVGA